MQVEEEHHVQKVEDSEYIIEQRVQEELQHR